MRRALLAACLAAGIATPCGVAAEDERPLRPLLARVADEKDPGHAEAVAAWKALSPDDRAALARAALRSTDPGTAMVAAIAADPEALDLEELHLQSAAQAPDPLARLLPPAPWAFLLEGRPAYGSKDLPAIWAALGQREPGPKDLSWSGLHRSLLPEDVPALVPLLETAGPKTFRALLADLAVVAEQQGGAERRPDFVRAFRYGLARLRAESAHKRPPRLSSPPAPPATSGLPAEFVELAKGTWGGEPGFAAAGAPPQETSGSPARWLHRWALELTPGDDDVPLLVAAIEGKSAPEITRIWAARRLGARSVAGGLGGRAAGHAYRSTLELEDGASLYAAAERAAHGDAADWKRLSSPDGDHWDRRRDLVAEARWLADPAAAEAAALKKTSKGDEPHELEEDERVFLEHDLGIVVSEDALRRIAQSVAAAPPPLRTELWFYAKVLPEALTPAVATRIASTWVARMGDVDPREATLTSFLATLDARAPDACVALLVAWAKAAKGDARPGVLDLLARTGDATEVDAMLAAWPAQPFRSLGRVKDPRVEAFLRKNVGSDDATAAEEALSAASIFYGAPEGLAAAFTWKSAGDFEPSKEARDRIVERVLARDPVGGAIELLRLNPWAGGGPAIPGLGLSKDPRAIALLRAWRAAHAENLCWHATAALALAGDEAARTEWRAFLAENRAFLLDALIEPTTATLDGDPGWTAFWVSRLDANCCHALHAKTALAGTYPTFPFENAPGDAGRARFGAERWFAKHRGTFVRSRILDGWVPGPSK